MEAIVSSVAGDLHSSGRLFSRAVIVCCALFASCCVEVEPPQEESIKTHDNNKRDHFI